MVKILHRPGVPSHVGPCDPAQEAQCQAFVLCLQRTSDSPRTGGLPPEMFSPPEKQNRSKHPLTLQLSAQCGSRVCPLCFYRTRPCGPGRGGSVVWETGRALLYSEVPRGGELGKTTGFLLRSPSMVSCHCPG